MLDWVNLTRNVYRLSVISVNGVIVIAGVGFWFREVRIGLRTILVFDDAGIPEGYLIKSWFSSIHFIAFFLVIWHEVRCIAPGNSHFLPILSPLLHIIFTPLPLLLPSCYSVWVWRWWLFDYRARGVPDPVLPGRILPFGRLTRPLTYGLVFFAVCKAIVNFVVFWQLYHFLVIIHYECHRIIDTLFFSAAKVLGEDTCLLHQLFLLQSTLRELSWVHIHSNNGRCHCAQCYNS